MVLKEVELKRDYIYKGRIIKLRNDEVVLPDGQRAYREVVEHPGGVCVLPLSCTGEITLVRQYRYPCGDVLLEAPAGKLDPGEEPLACGARELMEETGIRAERYISLGRVYTSPGFSTEIIYLYLALGLIYEKSRPDDGEFLEIVKMPLEDAVSRILDNKIADAKTQIIILRTHELVSRGKLEQ
ncbi:MAG TPA: NUDIX hydrolase [Clostridia bacterium]|nr:NUDIX hydrolase [Clostridia bacterium]